MIAALTAHRIRFAVDFRIFLSSGCHIAELYNIRFATPSILRHGCAHAVYVETTTRPALAHSLPDPSDGIREPSTARGLRFPSLTDYSLHRLANEDRPPTGKGHVGFT